MARPVSNKHFYDGGLNGDSALTKLLPNQFINGQNIRFGSSDRGGDDQIQSIGGTTLIPNALPALARTITVYDEDVEWTPSASGSGVTFNDTSNPFHGTIDTKIVLNSNDQRLIFYRNSSLISAYPFSYLNFYIYLTNPLYGSPFDGSVKVILNANFSLAGVQLDLLNYGLNPILTGVYQQIQIPISDFQLTARFNTVEFIVSTANSSNIIFIDYIQLIVDSDLALEKNREMGSCEDEARGRVFSFNWNPAGNHGIYCLDKSAGIIYTLLMDADVVGGLNFSKYSYIHSAFFINNCLYWPDGDNNEPRRLDTEAAIKAYQPTYNTGVLPYTLPVSQSVIAWIRRQPGLTPTQMKQTFGSPPLSANFIKYGAWQFCYRYQYRNFEYSTLSGLSNTANYNSESETFNYILVEIPFGEAIDQDVIQVDLVVRSLPDDTYFIINSWNTNTVSGAAAIAAHNALVTPLNYSFYNDSSGQALDDAYKVKPYDSVPINAQTAERAKNRTHLANFKLGYNTPTQSSLSYNFSLQNIPNNSNPATVVGTWYAAEFSDEQNYPRQVFDYYVLQTTFPVYGTEPPASVYYYSYYTGLPIYPPPFPPPSFPPTFYPATLLYSQITFVGSNVTAIINNIIPGHPQAQAHRVINLNRTTVITRPSVPITNFLSKAFKSDAAYQLSINFRDFYGRACGYETNNNLLVTIPDSAMVGDNFVVYLNWLLDNTNAINQIPVWAYYYSVNVTKCLRTRSFIQGLGNAIYAAKDLDGNYTFVDHIYSTSVLPSLAGIAIDISSLTGFQIGYIFTQGDICKTVISGIEYSLAIIAQVGQYIICELTDVGNLSFVTVSGNVTNSLAGSVLGTVGGTVTGSGQGQLSGTVTGTNVAGIVSGILNTVPNNGLSGVITDSTGKKGDFTGIITDFSTIKQAFFEIYTPYKKNTNEPSYEIGEIFTVQNPSTINRQYSVLSGIIGGDISVLLRTTLNTSFVAEAMSPNDKFWQIWNTDAGRPNFIDTIGQVVTSYQGAFSEVLLDGTKTNGLSTYDALNVYSVPLENGAIIKLQLAQKVEDKGSIMLAICQKETCSLYLGEVQLTSNEGATSIVTSNGIIGTINALKDSFGTYHPESVFEYNGLVFWFDIVNGGFIQYANNGLDFISRFDNRKNSELFSLALATLTPIQIEQLGSRPFVIGGVDPYHKEACWTIPATSASPASGFLPDYGSPLITNPYQLYDGSAGTWVFKFLKNQWMGNRTFTAEGLRRSGNDLFGWKEGAMWKFNDPSITNQNTFFGIYRTSRIAGMENSNPSMVKSFENAGLKSNMAPIWAHFETIYPYIQCSDLTVDDWKFREGDWYAPVLRDRLSPNISGTFDERVYTGDKLRANTMMYVFEFDVTQQQLIINFVLLGYLESVGQTP